MLNEPYPVLTLAEQVAQMVVVRASGFLFDHEIRYPQWEPPTQTLQYWIQQLGVGGAILLGGSAAEIRQRTIQLQSWAKIPLLLAADVEEGVGQRFSSATWLPPAMALGEIFRKDPHRALKYAYQMGQITAQEASAIGLNWVLAPVADVNNNPDNPVINIRAFGETPEAVSHLVAAYIRGTQAFPVLTSAKHFPGHGDTAIDSHLELPTLPHTADRLKRVELPPFESAIAAGVDSIMTAHLRIPTWDDERPATLSKTILTGQLRDKGGFEGLIVTDALVMGAIANQYGANEAAVLAVEAGADILLMPQDPPGAIAAVCQAVESGRIARSQIEASVRRIWQAKQKVSLPDFPREAPTQRRDVRGVKPSLGAASMEQGQVWMSQIGQQDAFTAVSNILRDSMRCGGQLPIPAVARGYNLIVVDRALDCKYLSPQAPAIALPAQLGYQFALIDSHFPVEPPADLPPTVLQVFMRGNPFRGNAGLTHTASAWFEALLQAGQLKALAIYGSPYILEQFLSQLPSTLPYVFTYGQTPAAQAIALGEGLGLEEPAVGM
ncbi:MAG: beta-glucosidase [Desertifilum sp.]|nr:beta-glucosidase [Desertifilum sp.]